MENGQHNYAYKIFSNIIFEDPKWSEAWNKRATVLFLMKKYELSLKDIDKTLDLEPRHFGALDGLGQIQFKLNNFSESIQTYERLLTIVPHSSSAKKMLKLMNAQFI